MENNKNKKSVKFQGDMLNFCDFIQVFVFTTNHHLKQKRNRKFDFFSERSFFISLMNTKSGIFTRGFASRENTAFVVHSVK